MAPSAWDIFAPEYSGAAHDTPLKNTKRSRVPAGTCAHTPPAAAAAGSPSLPSLLLVLPLLLLLLLLLRLLRF
jgi:hypothetical protein